jgi:hypothetical protein
MIKKREELYTWIKKFVEYAKKCYEKHAYKTQRHVEFKIGQHVWLNIYDLEMPDGLTLHFTTKCVGPYEILHKPHPNVYTLKLLINFVAHSTFHISN